MRIFSSLSQYNSSVLCAMLLAFLAQPAICEDDPFRLPFLPSDESRYQGQNPAPPWRPLVVLNPQVAPQDEGTRRVGAFAREMEAGADMTFRVADRCKEIMLLSSSTLRVELTHGKKDVLSSPEDYLVRINRAETAAMICLRLESSGLPGNSGYRIYVSRVRPINSPAETGSSEFPAHLVESTVLADRTDQVASLQLARFLDLELSRQGFRPAPNRIQQAPLFLLRHSGVPSICVTLGYWSNQQDRAHLNDKGSVESIAQCLSRAISRFGVWLQTPLEEGE